MRKAFTNLFILICTILLAVNFFRIVVSGDFSGNARLSFVRFMTLIQDFNFDFDSLLRSTYAFLGDSMHVIGDLGDTFSAFAEGGTVFEKILNFFMAFFYTFVDIVKFFISFFRSIFGLIRYFYLLLTDLFDILRSVLGLNIV